MRRSAWCVAKFASPRTLADTAVVWLVLFLAAAGCERWYVDNGGKECTLKRGVTLYHADPASLTYMGGVRQHACADVLCTPGADAAPSHVSIETGAVSRALTGLAADTTYVS